MMKKYRIILLFLSAFSNILMFDQTFGEEKMLSLWY